MRHWIGLIIVLAGAYYLWTEHGHKLGAKPEPATPEVAWYLGEIDYHFAIVRERGNAWFFRGFHRNVSTSKVTSVQIKVFLREGGEWQVLDTYNLGELAPEARKSFDHPIRVPRGLERPNLRWEVVEVRRR